MTCPYRHAEKDYSARNSWKKGDQEWLVRISHDNFCVFEQYKAVCYQCAHISGALPLQVAMSWIGEGTPVADSARECTCTHRRTADDGDTRSADVWDGRFR